MGLWAPEGLETVISSADHQWLRSFCRLKYYFNLHQLRQTGHRLHYLVARLQDRGQALSSYYHLASVLVEPDQIRAVIEPLPELAAPLHLLWAHVSELRAWKDYPQARLWRLSELPAWAQGSYETAAAYIAYRYGGWVLPASELPLHPEKLPALKKKQIVAHRGPKGDLLALGSAKDHPGLGLMLERLRQHQLQPGADFSKVLMALAPPSPGQDWCMYRPYSDGLYLQPDCASSEIVTYRLCDAHDADPSYNGNWLVLGIVLAVVLILAVVVAIRICLPQVKEGPFLYLGPRKKRSRARPEVSSSLAVPGRQK